MPDYEVRFSINESLPVTHLTFANKPLAEASAKKLATEYPLIENIWVEEVIRKRVFEIQKTSPKPSPKTKKK